MTRKRLAILWLCLVLAAAGYLAHATWKGLPLQTDLMALLPREEQDRGLQDAKDAVTEKVMGRILVLVSSENSDRARTAAENLRTTLREQGLIESTNDIPAETAMKDLGTAYFPFRSGLLSEEDRARLLHGDGSALISRALSQIFGVSGLSDGRLVMRDPFLLFPSFLTSLPVPATRLTYDEGWLTVQEDGRFGVLLSARITGRPTSLAFQSRFMTAFNRFEEANKDIQILRLGGVFFAQASTRAAMGEAAWLSLLSLAATVLLLIGMFRSAMPVLLGVLAIATGCICATGACLLLFGSLHVAAQLFGASLIGVAVDYASIYFGQIFSNRTAPADRLRFVFPGLLLGMLTTVVGYITLAMAPFPGLHQVAIFSSVGLISSFLTVVLWFPLVDRTRNRPLLPVYGRLAGAFWDFWKSPAKRIARHTFVVALILTAGVGYTRLTIEDDVRKQQGLDPHLLAEQDALQARTGLSQAGQFYLVRASSMEAALQREEVLGERLTTLKDQGVIANWISMARFVPSQARQMENRALVSQFVQQNLPHYLELTGLEKVDLPDNPDFLRAEKVRALPALPLLQELHLPAEAGHITEIVMVEKSGDAAALRRAADRLPGTVFVDPAADMTALLAVYRERSIVLLAVSIVLIFPLLAWRYGWLGGLVVTRAPVLALAVTPGLLALVNEPFTFFSALGLIMILAMGVDYAVFCAEDNGAADRVQITAVGLAMLTAFASFGLLAMSGVAAIRSFGLTMATGLPLAYALAPWAGTARIRHRRSAT